MSAMGSSLRDRLRALRSVRSAVDVRQLLEIAGVVVVTWMILGWTPDRTITQVDGSLLVTPYLETLRVAAGDWTNNLYRFGVLGGSKLHEFGGTMPLAELCARLGLSTTATANILTIFLQTAIAFFSISSIAALVSILGSRPAELGGTRRVLVVWFCAFAPLLGWRIGVGHENLLLGLLPYLAAVSLLLTAHVQRVSAASLAFAAFAVANGISGLGAQTVIYSAVFGLPVMIAVLFAVPRAPRWSRDHGMALAALAAGVLIMLPRLSVMIAHALGDDASRSLDESVVYSFKQASVQEWLKSLAWEYGQNDGYFHERNYPVGPLLCFIALCWPRGSHRWLLLAVTGSTLLGIALALDLPGISPALRALVPPLESFRVPERAVLPALILVPILALAAWWVGVEGIEGPRASRKEQWLVLLLAALAMVVAHRVPVVIREPLGWFVAIGLAVAMRRRVAGVGQRQLTLLLPLIAVIGIAAFRHRVPMLPADPIEQGPHALRAVVLAHAPEVAMPLARVQVHGAPAPYRMSTAWAAGVSSLDGVWYPPRRFLDLVSALEGAKLPPTACVFEFAGAPYFSVLQQLFNVRYLINVRDGVIRELPPTPGAAWFPSKLERVRTASDFVRALHARRQELRSAIGDSTWILDADAVPLPANIDARCGSARVTRISTDDVGQRAAFDITSPAHCVMVVATNYVSTFHASRDGQRLPVFPVNIALTGIAVPPGTSSIVLAPHVLVALWARFAQWLGIALLMAVVALRVRGASRQAFQLGASARSE